MRLSEERLHHVVEAGGLATFEHDVIDGTFFASARFRELRGLPPDLPLTPEALIDTIHPEDRERVEALRTAAYDPTGKGRFRAQYRIVMPDGGIRWIRASAVVLFAEHMRERRATRVIGSLSDITSIKKTEEALRSRTERYELVIAGASAAIWDWDAVERRVRYSSQWKALRGYHEHEISDREEEWRDRLHPEDAPRVIEAFRAHTRGDTTAFNEQYRVLCKDGSWKWVANRGVAQRNERGRTIRVAGSEIDITERKSAELENARFAALVQSSPDAIVSCALDGRILSWNPGAEDMFGYSAAEAIGQTAELIVPHGHADGSLGFIPRAITEGRISAETQRRHKNGTLIPVVISAATINNKDGTPVGVSAVLHDMTTHKRAEERLRQAAIVFQTTHEAIVVTDSCSRILSVNPAFSRITGYAESEVVGRDARLLQSGVHPPEFYEGMWRDIVEHGVWQGEIWNKRKDGEVFPQVLSISAVSTDKGTVSHYVGTSIDVSQIKKSELQLEHLAHHDALTNLPNRSLLQSSLKLAISRSRRERTLGAVLFLDLDRFKNVNDSLGHAAGDELLVKVVARLKERVRRTDTLARFGGDEFVVVLDDVGCAENAGRVAQALINKLESSFTLSGGQEVYISASVGISMFPDHACVPDLLIQHADAALYDAKEAGRGTYRFYDAGLTQAASVKLDTDARMRRALDRSEFVVHYQPLVSLRDGAIVGMEALVRWSDPLVGLIPPAKFIPLAEETGFIVALGEFVLRTACSQMRAWHDRGLPIETIAVNLSPRQFRCPGLIETIESILLETRLDPGCLELEITEGALMEQGRDAESRLHALKSIGVRLAIDDFGTGYSSLGYLRRFPVDKLKVDQSFIRAIPGEPTAMEISSAIIALGKTLGLKVLAEGVETEAQREFVTNCHCDMAQGYLFGKPMPAENSEALLVQIATHTERGSQDLKVA